MSAISTISRLCLVLAACAMVLVSAPAAAQDEPSSSAAPAEVTPSGSWQVLAYDPWAEGLVEPRQSSTLTVALLTGGRLEGQTGCGRYFGGYSIEDDHLGLGIISKGFGECGAKKTEEAVAFSVALEAVVGWQVSAEGSGLELLDENGSVRVVLAPDPNGDPLGEWLVTAYARANGKLTEPLAESPMHLALEAGGGASGSTGCRFFEGEYRYEGDRLVIGPIEPIGLRCEGPERKPERRLLASFGETVHWQREGDTLTLTDAFDAPLVVLEAAPTTEALPSSAPSPATLAPSEPPLADEA